MSLWQCVCVVVFTLNHAILRFKYNQLGNETESVDFIHLKPTWNVPGNFFVKRPTQPLYSFFHSIIMTYMIPWNRRFVLYVFEEKRFRIFQNVGNDMIGLLPHTAKGKNKKCKGPNKQKCHRNLRISIYSIKVFH